MLGLCSLRFGFEFGADRVPFQKAGSAPEHLLTAFTFDDGLRFRSVVLSDAIIDIGAK